jgi:hypothetical protein
MGIKFHCPSGHKLNVKAFLAGKRGVCPKCGAKLRIPTASEPGLDGDGDGDAEDGEADETDLAQAAAAKSNGAGVVTETPVAAKVAAPAVAVTPAAEAAAPATAPAADDPIAEQPTAIWYVRPPGGGQYGPARGDVMRKWLTEGRVSGDSLVWREGWTDWQTAAKLFPQLNHASQARPEPATPTVANQATLAPRTSARAGARYQAKQQNTSTLGVGILIGLAVICLALVAVLVYVLLRLK